MRAKAAPALVRGGHAPRPRNHAVIRTRKRWDGMEMSSNRMASRRQLAAAAAMIEATCDVVEIGAPGGIETVLALAALDEAAMWVGRMLGPRGES